MNDIEKQDVVLETAAQEEAQESDFESACEKTMVQIHPGDIIKGKVVQITDDEVCVNIGYTSDGLVKKAALCTPEVAIGDEIEVEVVKVNDGEGNVILSQKNIVNKRNWDAIMAKYGDRIKMAQRIPKALSGAMADMMYLCNVSTPEEKAEYYASLLAER